ncbi:hypothetical protein ACFL5U_02545 [Candidatus Margulisiibacteriota bacterium]
MTRGNVALSQRHQSRAEAFQARMAIFRNIREIGRMGRASLTAGREALSRQSARLDRALRTLADLEITSLPEEIGTQAGIKAEIDGLTDQVLEYPTESSPEARSQHEQQMHSALTRFLRDQLGIKPVRVPAAKQTRPPKPLEQKVTDILNELRLQRDIPLVLDTFKFLSEAGLARLHARYESEFNVTNPDGREIVGAIAELKMIHQISKEPNLEVVGARTRATHHQTTDKIEFFDVIARSRATGKLTLFEVKHDNRYTLGDFICQFFGIGGYIVNESDRQSSSLFEVLLSPEEFQLPEHLAQEIASGNYEVRILTHRKLEEFRQLYGERHTIDSILRLINNQSSQIIYSKAAHVTPTDEEIRDNVSSIRARIERQRPQLAGIRITFGVMG